MSKAFILIPGARLPAEVAPAVLEALTDAEKAALLTLQRGEVNLVTQRFDEGPYRRAPHRLWLWKVLTRESTYPREAPWYWLSLGARELSPELWSLTPLSLDASTGKVTGAVTLTNEQFFAACMALQKTLSAHKFQLQMWDTLWFVTRKDNWPVVTAPLATLVGQTLSPELMVGDGVDETWTLLTALRDALPDNVRVAGVDALWLWGGGRDCRFNPPTLIRSVASNDPIVLGWANASGILNTFLVSEEKGWPAETAPGDVVVHLDALYEPWLREDWDAWRAALPTVAAQVERYRTLARARDKDAEILTVCFGETGAVTLAPTAPTLMKRLFGSRSASTLLPWYIDSYDSHR